MPNKKAYFQGTELPTPGKKKYKSDPAIVVQPRFKEPFYRNYDLYDVPGEHGPGSGWNEVMKHPSIKEFLKFRRNKLKDKYKADDSWILDSGEKTKKNPNMETRAQLLSRLIKTADSECQDSDMKYDDGYDAYVCKKCKHVGFNGPGDPKPTVAELHSGKDYTLDDNDIDFPIDDQVNQEGSMIYPSEESYHNPVLVGPGDGDLSSYPSDTGTTDQSSYINSTDIAGEHSYLPLPDEEGRSGEALNFGRDYTGDEFPGNLKDEDLQKLINKYLSPAESELFGLPDGIDPNSDLDADKTINDENPYQGITDSGEQMYEDKWNI